MSESTHRLADGHVCYHADPDATAHDLMNEATQWLQFARGLTGLLSEFVHEADVIDGKRLALGLDGIEALMHMGVQCTAQAHVRMCWEMAKLDKPGR
jgi:hypothetical protein